MGVQQYKRYKTPILGVVVGIVIGLVIAIGMGSVLPWRPAPHKIELASAGELPHQLFRAPEFRNFKNQLGQNISSKKFLGKVQLITFMWPGCSAACPLLASRMVNLEVLLRKRGLENKVALLSFNVDPEDSDPAQMKQYMEQYGANTSSGLWQFLTSTPAAISNVVRQGYHANFEKVAAGVKDGNKINTAPSTEFEYLPRMMNPMASQGGSNYEIVNDASAIIVGRHGEVLYVLPKAYMESEAALLNDIIRALDVHKGV